MNQYKVITHDHRQRFEELISQAITEGWALVGGVSTTVMKSTQDIDIIVLSQALSR